MRAVFWLAALFGLTMAGMASAQAPQDQKPQTQVPSAIELETPESGSKKPGGLVPGANSFAESQAKALIESKGYDNVSALMNDSKGIWHGTATKGQAKVHVSVDYKGNVDAQ